MTSWCKRSPNQRMRCNRHNRGAVRHLSSSEGGAAAAPLDGRGMLLLYPSEDICWLIMVQGMPVPFMVIAYIYLYGIRVS